MGDDLYQNDGESFTNGVYYPTVPEEQIEEEIRAKSIMAGSYPIMDNVADWFKDAIKECDSISNIETTTVTINNVKYSRTIHIEAQVLAYQLLKSLLSDKANEFGEFGEGKS